MSATQAIMALTDDTVLYAVWIALYSVTYNGSGNTSGTVPKDTGQYDN
ncbi:MAG: hypothetical protein FWH42_02020 [Dehalococcoidia bacterium]|nr:hypothetical protein [Dehalococcoidia bacterium]